MPSKPDANFIWSIANLLRGPYKPKEYGDVVLPMTILRRLDCVLAATKDAVLSEQKRSGDRTAKDLGPYPRILDTGCDYAAVGSVAVLPVS